MAKKVTLDKKALLEQLSKIEYEPEDETEDAMLEEMSLSKSLLKLAEIDHEREYGLCRTIAEYLLETVPEPDDLELEPE